MAVTIPKQTYKVYMERTLAVGQDRYEAEHIYNVDSEIFKELTTSDEEGKTPAACKVDFPSLDAIEQSIDYAVDAYKKQREELKAHPKYDDAPSLRTHELQELRKGLDKQVAEMKEKYEIEIQALQREVADKMYTLQASEDTAYLNVASTQLQFGNPVTTLQSLLLKADQVDEAGKLAILQSFSDIANKAQSHKHYSYYKAEIEKKLGDLYEKASNVPTIRENERRLQQLDELYKHKSGVDSSYRMLNIIEKA
ncbi:hypothetical protein U2I54_19995 [Bacillus pseudomycoides]|uniref:Uncharacterized protein n=1 Tax=Bacillus bingmayongensis TaxID=1150157 RepID=A0ABU5K1T2_9BACI|nr:hypothetical protein [Bacillus pseudomycoides]